MKLIIKNRPLYEMSIQKAEIEPEFVEWCESNATFIQNRNDEEFQFWVPPFDDFENIVEKYYGKEIPTEIKETLRKISSELSKELDQGYLLLVLI